MAIGDRIREKRKQKHLTLQQIADEFGIARSSVADWEAGRTQPDSRKLARLAELLGLTATELLSDNDTKRPVIGQLKDVAPAILTDHNVAEVGRPAGLLPVISWAQAGEWSETVDNFQPGDADEWVVCPFPHSEASFVLRVVGESMYNPGADLSFRDGDYISVDPRREALHRSLVIAKRDTDPSATFRQLIIENDGVVLLQSLNPSWPTRYLTVDVHTRIVGVVTGQWRPVP